MKEVIYRCDICGKECDPDQMLHTDEHDVCSECLEKLVEEHFRPKTAEQKEKKEKKEVEQKQEAPKHQRKKREQKPREFDRGKAQALRNSGWSVTMIADEMGCCPQTVYNYTTTPTEERKTRPNEFIADDLNRLNA